MRTGFLSRVGATGAGCLGLVWLALAGCSPAKESTAGVDGRLVAANTRFAFKLFAQLVQTDPTPNLFVSPSGVAFILAMLYNGAAGETQQAMAQALELRSRSSSGGMAPRSATP